MADTPGLEVAGSSLRDGPRSPSLHPGSGTLEAGGVPGVEGGSRSRQGTGGAVVWGPGDPSADKMHWRRKHS